ncbi:MAG: hypothetical protein ACT4OO_06125 [Nitrospiraceae bacterium]
MIHPIIRLPITTKPLAKDLTLLERLTAVDWTTVKGPQHNKREKLANLLFDLAKYLLTVIGIGAILPESKVALLNFLIGVFIAVALLVVALFITPEERA